MKGKSILYKIFLKEILRKGQKRRVAEDLQAFLSGMEDK